MGKRVVPMMEEKRFWDLIDASWRAEKAEQLAEVVKQLSHLEPDDLIGFDERLWESLAVANRAELWSAAGLIMGWASDDGFRYFQCWLVAQGRQVFQAALENPDTLAEVEIPGSPIITCNFEMILSAASEAWREMRLRWYETNCGSEDEDPDVDPCPYPYEFSEACEQIERRPWRDVQGEFVNLKDDELVRRRFPRLFAKYGR